MRFREESKEKLKNRISVLLNELLMTFRDENITEDEMKYMAEKTFQYFKNSNDFVSKLDKIYDEMTHNFRLYNRLCLAAILTAYKNVRERENV